MVVIRMIKNIKKAFINNTWRVTGCGCLGLGLCTIWLDAGDVKRKCGITTLWLILVFIISIIVKLDYSTYNEQDKKE